MLIRKQNYNLNRGIRKLDRLNYMQFDFLNRFKLGKI